MRVIQTNGPFPDDRIGQLSWYNAMDVLSLFEIHEGLQAELDENRMRTYLFEMDLQAALLDMSFAGLPVDLPRRQQLIQQTECEKARVDEILHKLCEAIGYYDFYLRCGQARFAAALEIEQSLLPSSWAEWLAVPVSTRRQWKLTAGEDAIKEFQRTLKEAEEPFNANSPTQKLKLLYHFFGSPDNGICRDQFPDWLPPWNKTRGITEYKSRDTNGEYTPSSDREALEKILTKACDRDDAVYWARPFVQCCLALADLNKVLGFLKCRLENGIFRYSFGAVTDTGRLASKKNAMGYGSNAQNVSPKLRSIFAAPIGYKFAYPDFEQIESRCVAARCFNLFGATAYLNGTMSGDLHSLACSMVWEDLPWPKDFTLEWLAKHGPFPPDMVKAAKKIAGEPFYRGKSRRDVSKTLGHGSNYLGKPAHMARQSHIEQALVQHYQDVYFSVFPEIKQWHQWIIERLQVDGEITTLMGRTRQFFDRPSDDSTVRAAVAFDPQSTAADYCNTALMAILRETIHGFPVQLHTQAHDAMVLSFKEQDESLVIPRIKELMEHRVQIKAPDGRVLDWFVPAEMVVGWNLGKKSDKNPDGLTGWPDSRERKENPFSLL